MAKKLTSEQYAQALFEAVSETAPKDQDKVLDNFLKILVENGDLQRYEEIERAYKIVESKAKGILQAEITTAREVELNSEIVDQLNKIAKGKLELKEKVDEEIIGGIVMRVDNTLLDASVKTELNNLNNELKS